MSRRGFFAGATLAAGTAAAGIEPAAAADDATAPRKVGLPDTAHTRAYYACARF